LAELRNWRVQANCRRIAMESTGFYWQPIYDILETAFIDEMALLVVNARHMKNIPGKKMDMRDAEWIGTLLRAGLLTAASLRSGTSVTCVSLIAIARHSYTTSHRRRIGLKNFYRAQDSDFPPL
jgi:hypothetical protein